MTSRFASNMLLLVCGGLLVAMAPAVAPAVIGWVALGTGAAAVLVTACAFLARGRGALQRSFDLLVVTTGAWTILASVTFTGSTLRWLSFAEAATLCGLCLAGLVAHEVVMERAAPGRPGPHPPYDGDHPGSKQTELSEPTRVGVW